jgi:uncharacterized membrane protein (Fun14 family)
MDFLGLTGSQIVVLIATFILGLLIGILVRRIIGVALVLIAIVILLLALGYISPNTVESVLIQIGNSASQALSRASSIKAIIPYSSITFIIGFIIGIIKG